MEKTAAHGAPNARDAEQPSAMTAVRVQEDAQSSRHWLSQFVYPVSFLAIGAMGFTNAVTTIWHNFYSEMKQTPLLKDARDARNAELNNIYQKANGNFADLLVEKRTHEKAYAVKVKEALVDKMGMRNDWVGGTIDRLRFMKGGPQRRVMFQAGMTTVVMLGALAILRDNFVLRTQIQDKEKNHGAER